MMKMQREPSAWKKKQKGKETCEVYTYGCAHHKIHNLNLLTCSIRSIDSEGEIFISSVVKFSVNGFSRISANS